MRKFSMVAILALSSAIAVTPALADAVTAPLKGAQGQDVGLAELAEGPRGVLVRFELKGLKPGWHAVHFHEKGDCAAPDFKSAGGHVHPAAVTTHGLLNPASNDQGDLPNVFVTADGTARAEMFSPLVSLHGVDGRPALLDADGSAIVIHAGQDDHQSQPIGGAGAREACGVIR